MESESKGRWVSPNEMFSKAKELVLKGKEPETKTEWLNVIVFCGVNVATGLEIPVCKIFAKLINAPLSDKEVYLATVHAIAHKHKAKPVK